MTREETVRNLITELIDMIDNGSQRDLDRADEIGTSIIKLLEQEPCEDAISRQIISDYVGSHIQEIDTGYGDLNKHTNEILRMIVKYIESMPSVTPKPKTGHWIEKAEDYYKAINDYGGGVDENTDYFTDDIACPKCLSKFSVIDNETERFKYCPNCGAKMEESE